ncbi:MAG: hypothetical protein J5966_10540 [Lachnospiraceae bacterium]|nr:hypothetical protein [Lachnospiraceae bacterium]
MFKKIIAAVCAATLLTSALTACGSSEDYYEDEYGYEQSTDEGSVSTGADPEENTPSADASSGRRGYETENVISNKGVTDKPHKKTDPEIYADSDAYKQGMDDGNMDYIRWLADYCANIIEPQAVEMLLTIPAFKRAAEKGLLSRYIVLGISYETENQYGAIKQTCYLGKNGNVQGADDVEKVYNIGHRISVNSYIYQKNCQNDPAEQREIADLMLHELMHGFMSDYTRNALTGLKKAGELDDTENNALPDWFAEGTAITVQGGYGERREEILEKFSLSEDSSKEEILTVFGSTESMYENSSFFIDQLSEEELKEYKDYYGGKLALPTDITLEENTYNMSYIGAMFTYYMAAESMGLKPFDENGVLQMDVMREGLSRILDMMYEGYSLDEIIALISKDPQTGASRYADTKDLENKFLYSAGDYGMSFVQKLLYDFESRIEDRLEYIPSGSVIEGYNNRLKDFMDHEYHDSPEVFEIVNSPLITPEDEYYAVSTVLPSKLALGGGCHVSYKDAPGLSEDEEKEANKLFTGDEICLVGFYEGSNYKSPEQWIKLSDTDGGGALPASDAAASADVDNNNEGHQSNDDNSGFDWNDIYSNDYVRGFYGTSNDEDYILLFIFEDSSGQQYGYFETDQVVLYQKCTLNDVLMISEKMPGTRVTLEDGNYLEYYKDKDGSIYILDDLDNVYSAEKVTESEAWQMIEEYIPERKAG